MKYYCINSILGLTSFILAVCQAITVRSGICPNPITGEHTRYDMVSEICCGGKVFPVNPNARAICCGERTYNPREEICCGGEISPRSAGLECCNFETWYNSTQDLCCGSRVYSRENDRYKCCGSDKYDTESETCCPVVQDGVTGRGHREPLPGVGQCCGNTVIDPFKEICCGGVANRRGSPTSLCCGNTTYDFLLEECCDNQTPYDPNSHLCCSGKVHLTAGDGARCCGTESYDSSQSSCCHDNIFSGIPEVSGIQSCCGGVSYFKSDQMCCEGTLHDRGVNTECCGQESYNSSSHLCCGLADQSTILKKSSSADQCCGLSTYDPERQTCCEAASRTFDVANGHCCGTSPWTVQIFDPSSATCCRGTRGEMLYWDAPTDQSRCCGSYLLSENGLCDPMDESIVHKTTPLDDTLCHSLDLMNVLTYNSRTQFCTPEGIIGQLSETVALCGYNTYNPQAEVCCEGFIRGRFDENGNERECCPGTMISFSPVTQTCCAGNVHDIPSELSSCCRTQAYNPATHVCEISGDVRSLEEVANFPNMCGMTPYNPNDRSCCMGHLILPDQLCCQGVPVTLPDGVLRGECCGYFGYDPESDICCDGVVRRKQSNDSTCCGWELLADPAHSICCDGSVHPRRGSRTTCDGSVAYNPQTETVCSGVVYPVADGDCCGSQIYDDSTDICCSGHLHPKTSITVGCCGTETYDMEDSSALCCDGHLHRDAAERECCGENTIDPSSQHCCQAQTTSIILPNDRTSTQSSLTCCDINTYHSSQHTCCGGIEHKYVTDGECCGIDIIRSAEEEICCGGQVLPKYFGEHTGCCGSQLIDTRYSGCCNDRIITVGYQECCGGEVIHNLLQSCCGGEIYNNDNTTVGCCDGTSYNTETQDCCIDTIFETSTSECDVNGFVVPLAFNTLESVVVRSTEHAGSSMCGDIEYHIDTHSCCGNSVYGHEENVICCEGRLWDSTTGKTECCAHVPYNPNNYDCCDGETHDKIDEAECCGSSYFQPSKETCCSDHVVVSLGETCPGSSDVFSPLYHEKAAEPRCLCDINTRNQRLPAACLAQLRSKLRIIVGVVEITPEEDGEGGRELRLRVSNVLRGSRPTHLVDGSVRVVISPEHSCRLPTIREGHKVAIFTNVIGTSHGTLHLSRNDVVLAYNKKLGKRLKSSLGSND